MTMRVMSICPVCGGGYIGLQCEPCNTYVEPRQADIEKTLANMAAEQARLGASIEPGPGYFMPKIVSPGQPEQMIDG